MSDRSREKLNEAGDHKHTRAALELSSQRRRKSITSLQRMESKVSKNTEKSRREMWESPRIHWRLEGFKTDVDFPSRGQPRTRRKGEERKELCEENGFWY